VFGGVLVEDQKIAACGSSYIGMRFNVGAAAGGDLLLLP
jgi:hypothetical protein